MQILTGSPSLEQLYAITRDIPQVTNEIHKPNDYYGHATNLKKYARCPPEYQIKASMEHGASVGNYVWDVDLNTPLPAIITLSSYRCQLLRKQTRKALFAIGPSLRYAPYLLDSQAIESEKNRLGKHLLVFPPHSTHWIYGHYDIHDFCQKLESIGREFDNIRICLYWKDILRGHAKEYMQHGFECVTAGHIYDPLFLSRLKSIIECATMAMSNVVGTHLGYCILLDKPFYILPIDVKYTSEKEGIPHHRDETSSRIRKQISTAFRDMRDDISFEQRDLIAKYWGLDECKTPEEIRMILQVTEDMYNKGPSFFMNNINLIEYQVKDYLDSNQKERASFLTEQSSAITSNFSLSGEAEASNSEIKASEVLALMQKALDSLNANQNDIAFNYLNEAKSLKTPVEELDFLRAIYFMRKNKPAEAGEALKEELRYFPNSENAIDLLARINKQYPQTSSVNIQDAEFLEILEAVRPYTMLSEQRLYSLFSLTKKVCTENISGNIVECGVAGGGSTALMAYVIKKYSRVPRLLYAFDSFEGMPAPTEHDISQGVSADLSGWGEGTCAAPENSVKQICSKLGVGNIVKTVKGYFQDTLPQMRDSIGDIVFLHMDGDWYESTKTTLEGLYDNVVAYGLIQVDDYGYWEGCKKAINEFEYGRNIKFAVNEIDGTGVWFSKPSVQSNSSTKSKTGHTKSNMLNLGCGNRYHPDWTNIDFQSSEPDVIAYDLNKLLPFEDKSFDVVYHSHLLEHFPQSRALLFTGECFRILKPGGIIRIVVPDLEQIAKCYLTMLEKSLQGVKYAQECYDWIMLELFDQMVRNVSGGGMLHYWKQDTIPAEDFVIKRVGSEVKNVLNEIRRNNGAATATMLQTDNKNITLDPYQIGRFRLSGEIHQWMYDRYSLGKLLKQAGFREIRVCQADESMIENFNSYLLDIEQDGSVRKPDSLFMEGRR